MQPKTIQKKYAEELRFLFHLFSFVYSTLSSKLCIEDSFKKSQV